MKKIACSFALLFTITAIMANAQRTDIAGPAGSGAFGTQVVNLPNGNFVVTDPSYDEGGTADVGAMEERGQSHPSGPAN